MLFSGYRMLGVERLIGYIRSTHRDFLIVHRNFLYVRGLGASFLSTPLNLLCPVERLAT
jgi:hypothetical protein